MLEELERLSELEKTLEEALKDSDPSSIDYDTLEEFFGEEVRESIEQLDEISGTLEKAGYIKKGEERYELTSYGVRRIGHKALRDIFSSMKKGQLGRHEVATKGQGGIRIEETKKYEYGDPFQVDLAATLRNALFREEIEIPIAISPDDFEVYKSEYLTRSSTVLMLDMSWSMTWYDRFVAAKKVAMALNTLIRSRFPKDSLSIVGFYTSASEIRVDDLPYVTVGRDYTNMQEGLRLSREILSKKQGLNKQIIMITDGRPTAMTLNGQVQIRLYYSAPDQKIIEETLKEAERCTRSGITINTFMLANDDPLIDFVRRLTKVSHGRAFYSTPSDLGNYIVEDYVSKKVKRVSF
ncbi:MAG: VWA domain-containing protein [Candidatus Tectomicrobia bacterium]|nr:VWA domain-containing protein [Candidatus Tectomicrobia bacterium]